VGPTGGWHVWGVRETGLSALGLTCAAWLLGAAGTLLVIGTPYLLFGYYSLSMHLILNTASAFIAVLLAYLLLGRYLRSRRLQDLLLTAALAMLAISGMGVALAVAVFERSLEGTLDVWLPLFLSVTAASLTLIAAVIGDRLTDADLGRQIGVLAALVIAGAALLVMFHERLPVALGQTPPSSAARPVITGHPLLLIAQAYSAVCFLVASMAFTRQALRRKDAVLQWLGPACALLGFARVHYLLFPSLYSGWIYTGDVLRTAAYLVLLIGAAREIGQFWSAQARVAVLDDRRRLARELHDGVVQELAYIRTEARRIGEEESPLIVAACDRALDEARAAVEALGRSPEEPLGFALHRAAQQVAERYGARVDVNLDDSINTNHEQRHALVRITREAISNAIRHGGADRVELQLLRDSGACRLVVCDDGRGFDIEATSGVSTGYGLTSMAERARGLQGSFDITSSPGRGTRVEVTW
jgi:signal transduction histidine kinase